MGLKQMPKGYLTQNSDGIVSFNKEVLAFYFTTKGSFCLP